MKKVMFVAAVAMVFGLASCSKSKDCNCHWEVNGESVMPAEYQDFELKDQDDCDKPSLPDQYQTMVSNAAAMGQEIAVVCKEK
ncbi:MAG: hypothetical protein J6I49_03665 [Bacteroidales bacterium]|nr:hypothetical protein [Bacteroidales bacterium]